MKKVRMPISILLVLLLFMASVLPAYGEKPIGRNSNGAGTAGTNAGCATIQDGTILYSSSHYYRGQPIPLGFDAYGYNYQAHMFKGSYANVYLGGAGFPPYSGDDASYLAAFPSAAGHWAWPYRSTQLEMKWNDAWLANTDCGGDGTRGGTPDGKLDRYFGFTSYQGSGAWITNHMWDSYEYDGVTYNWNDFVKIVAAPGDAISSGGVWYSSDGVAVGQAIWVAFAVIQEVYNDPGSGYNGILSKSELAPGFGLY